MGSILVSVARISNAISRTGPWRGTGESAILKREGESAVDPYLEFENALRDRLDNDCIATKWRVKKARDEVDENDPRYRAIVDRIWASKMAG
jgi:hypothetical protein